MPVPLRIAVLPSARLGVLLCVLHLGAGTLGLFLPVPHWSKATLVVGIAWSLVRCLKKYALLQAPGAIVRIDMHNDGGVIAYTRERTSLECELLCSTFVSHRLTVLNLRPRSARQERHVVLCCGNVSESELRRLRIRLRWAMRDALNCQA